MAVARTLSGRLAGTAERRGDVDVRASISAMTERNELLIAAD
jgi:hypothetical protein